MATTEEKNEAIATAKAKLADLMGGEARAAALREAIEEIVEEAGAALLMKMLDELSSSENLAHVVLRVINAGGYEHMDRRPGYAVAVSRPADSIHKTITQAFVAEILRAYDVVLAQVAEKKSRS